MNFQLRLKELVKRDFASQVELADTLGLSKIAINSYITGKRKPNFEVLEKFHNLGYNVDWLISGKGSMKRTFADKDELDEYDKVVLIILRIFQKKFHILAIMIQIIFQASY